MSGEIALRALLLAELRADAGLMALVNAVEDGSAPKLSPPVLTLGALIAGEWGARGLKGLSVRVPLTLVDRIDVPDRLGAAAARIDVVMDGLPVMAGDWRVGTVRFERSRTVRGDGLWSMLIDYAVRVSRLG